MPPFKSHGFIVGSKENNRYSSLLSNHFMYMQIYMRPSLLFGLSSVICDCKPVCLDDFIFEI